MSIYSQAYKNIEIVIGRISLIFKLSVMFLPFQIGLRFVMAAVVFAILERIAGLDPSSESTDPRYLKLLTVSSFLPQTLISVSKSSA